MGIQVLPSPGPWPPRPSISILTLIRLPYHAKRNRIILILTAFFVDMTRSKNGRALVVEYMLFSHLVTTTRKTHIKEFPLLIKGNDTESSQCLNVNKACSLFFALIKRPYGKE